MTYWVIIAWAVNPFTSYVEDQFVDKWKFQTYESCNQYVAKNYEGRHGPDGDDIIFMCREYKK